MTHLLRVILPNGVLSEVAERCSARPYSHAVIVRSLATHESGRLDGPWWVRNWCTSMAAKRVAGYEIRIIAVTVVP